MGPATWGLPVRDLHASMKFAAFMETVRQRTGKWTRIDKVREIFEPATSWLTALFGVATRSDRKVFNFGPHV